MKTTLFENGSLSSLDLSGTSETAVKAIFIKTPELGPLPSECSARLLAAPARLSKMTSDWITETGLTTVVFALFSVQPDAWQIAGHLIRIGFAGRVIALAPPLPNPRMVERELRAEYPSLRLCVLMALPAG